jgi:type I restriction enzyme S subunit
LPALSADSAVPGLNRNIAYLNDVLVPPSEILIQFDKLVSGLRAKIHQNSDQNETLADLRDTLLPKLMSGKIRVPIDNKMERL